MLAVVNFVRSYWKILAVIAFIGGYTTAVYVYAQNVIEDRIAAEKLKAAELYNQKLEVVLSDNAAEVQRILEQNATDIQQLTDVEDSQSTSIELNNAIDILRRRQ